MTPRGIENASVPKTSPSVFPARPPRRIASDQGGQADGNRTSSATNAANGGPTSSAHAAMIHPKPNRIPSPGELLARIRGLFHGLGGSARRAADRNIAGMDA